MEFWHIRIDLLLYRIAIIFRNPHSILLEFSKMLCLSRLLTIDLIFIFHFLFYFSVSFLFLSFSIFRTTWVRGYQSRCHISHKLMAKSQDWSRDLGELSRRFENKCRHTTWTPHVGLMYYSWSFRVGCTVVSTDHRN